MSKKWIPNGDQDFEMMAAHFARTIAADPARFDIQQEDAQALASAVKQFREAFLAIKTGSRSQVATDAKNQARLQVVKIVRRLGNLIRASDKIDSAAKIMLNLRERSAKAKVLHCPQEPPKLKFVRALHEGNGATPVHELSFGPMKLFSRVKPPGAVRLELFVDLIPPEEPIPAHPGANHGSRPWYLRSFTRSPIRLIPPMARMPMRVVYWGRWADSLGNVGPFSATAVAWIEGGSHHMLAPALLGNKPVPILEDANDPGPAGRNTTYIVAVLEAQQQSFNGQEIAPPALQAPEQRETRRLEGPASEAA